MREEVSSFQTFIFKDDASGLQRALEQWGHPDLDVLLCLLDSSAEKPYTTACLLNYLHGHFNSDTIEASRRLRQEKLLGLLDWESDDWSQFFQWEDGDTGCRMLSYLGSDQEVLIPEYIGEQQVFEIAQTFFLHVRFEMEGIMRKIILSVAPVSGEGQSHDPGLVADDLTECYKLGATQMHIHVRDLQNRLTADTSYMRNTIERVRNRTDMIVEVSTGGISQLSIEERCRPCMEPLVELTSLNVGSVNLGKAPYINPPDDVRYCVRKALEYRKHPEAEIFEIGHLYTLKALADEFHISQPHMISLVFGYQGIMPANEMTLRHMVTACKEVFPREEFYWGYIEANRQNWTMVENALDMGAMILRVGFEDSPYLAPGLKARTNAELVEKALEIMQKHGVEPMKPSEARTLLKNPQLS